jgi:hypothetical protein
MSSRVAIVTDIHANLPALEALALRRRDPRYPRSGMAPGVAVGVFGRARTGFEAKLLAQLLPT